MTKTARDRGKPAGESHAREPRDITYYLEKHLRVAPLPRVLVRSAECVMLAAREWPRPLLDLGAGDGTFARVLFDEAVDIGIDPDPRALRQARPLVAYRSLAVALGAPLPFKDASFASLLSNSTLEHIPDLDPVISEISRVLRPDGICVFTVPSDHFLDFTYGVRFLRKIRLGVLARLYGNWFNRISRHHHCDSPEVWRERLERAGLRLLEWRYYFSSGSTGALELAHYVSVPSLLTKLLLGRWVLWPGKVRFLPLARWLRRVAEPGGTETGGYLLLVCQKPR